MVLDVGYDGPDVVFGLIRIQTNRRARRDSETLSNTGRYALKHTRHFSELRHSQALNGSAGWWAWLH